MTIQVDRGGAKAESGVSLHNNLEQFTQGELQIERCGLNCIIITEALRSLLVRMGIRENIDILLKKLAMEDFSPLARQLILGYEVFIRYYFRNEFEIEISPCNGDVCKCRWYHVADKA